MPADALLDYIRRASDDRLYAVAQLFRLGTGVDAVAEATAIDRFFLYGVVRIVQTENALRESPGDGQALYAAKRMGFCDKEIARLWGNGGIRGARAAHAVSASVRSTR